MARLSFDSRVIFGYRLDFESVSILDDVMTLDWQFLDFFLDSKSEFPNLQLTRTDRHSGSISCGLSFSTSDLAKQKLCGIFEKGNLRQSFSSLLGIKLLALCCELLLVFVRILDLVWRTDGVPGWSPRANQRWTALFQRFQKFQRWSALFQNGLRKPALISAVSELFSAGFLWISAVQRWIKTKWETDENASCKFEKVLRSQKTCSFGVYQLWKKSFRRNFSQKFELTHPPLPHASWSHVPCRIVKRLKYRVFSKKWNWK